jgi:UDP-N-acetylglucosamine 1-carboxyvinyltransferase
MTFIRRAIGGTFTITNASTGTNTITITGVKELHGVEYTPIPDRIITGSYLIAVVCCGGNVTLKNVVPKHNENLIDKLKSAGAIIKAAENELQISYDKKTAKQTRINFNIHTASYPGYPTDLQSQFAVLSCVTKGQTVITESIFENRFRYCPELQKMGAKIAVTANKAVIKGVNTLTAVSTPHICPIAYMKNRTAVCDGLVLTATDLRGGVALVIAGLTADGTTTIENAEYIYRGHADIVRDLVGIGANIIRTDD